MTAINTLISILTIVNLLLKRVRQFKHYKFTYVGAVIGRPLYNISRVFILLP